VTSFTVAWGNNPDQLGLQAGPEIERTGPLTFCVSPQGELYVADTIHRAIKRWQADGTFGGTVAQDVRPTAMAFDSEGRLLLLTGRQVTVATQGGQPVMEMTLPAALDILEGYGQDVFEENGAVCVNNPDDVVYCFPLDDPRPTTASRVMLGRRGQNGKRVFVRKDSAELYAHELPAEAAAAPAQAARSLQKGWRLADLGQLTRATGATIGGVVYKGFVPERNAHFFETEAVAGNKVRLLLRTVSSGGKSTARELPNDYYTTVYRKIEVLPDGSAWQMLTSPSGVQFIHWSVTE
jgi:hypothetical protein